MALQRSVDEEVIDTKCLWNKDVDPRYLAADPKQEKIARRIKTQEDEDRMGG
jgi:hypothetical protein